MVLTTASQGIHQGVEMLYHVINYLHKHQQNVNTSAFIILSVFQDYLQAHGNWGETMINLLIIIEYDHSITKKKKKKILILCLLGMGEPFFNLKWTSVCS